MVLSARILDIKPADAVLGAADSSDMLASGLGSVADESSRIKRDSIFLSLSSKSEMYLYLLFVQQGKLQKGLEGTDPAGLRGFFFSLIGVKWHTVANFVHCAQPCSVGTHRIFLLRHLSHDF